MDSLWTAKINYIFFDGAVKLRIRITSFDVLFISFFPFRDVSVAAFQYTDIIPHILLMTNLFFCCVDILLILCKSKQRRKEQLSIKHK